MTDYRQVAVDNARAEYAPPDRPDGLDDAAILPRRTLTDYERGYIEGMFAYAFMRDGIYYLGTTGKTYRQAVRAFLDEVGA